MPERNEIKIYAPAVLTITTLDTAVFEIGAFAKWFLKIFIPHPGGIICHVTQRNSSARAHKKIAYGKPHTLSFYTLLSFTAHYQKTWSPSTNPSLFPARLK